MTYTPPPLSDSVDDSTSCGGNQHASPENGGPCYTTKLYLGTTRAMHGLLVTQILCSAAAIAPYRTFVDSNAQFVAMTDTTLPVYCTIVLCCNHGHHNHDKHRVHTLHVENAYQCVSAWNAKLHT